MQSIPDLIRTIGERLVGDGVPVSRIFVIVPTLHPEYIGQAFRWLRDDPEVFQGFGQHGVQHTSRYLDNPLKLVIDDGYAAVRRRLEAEYVPGEFPLTDELKGEGVTDYVCMSVEFVHGERTAISFASDRPGGFSESHLRQFNDMLPMLARLLEREMLRSTAINVLDTYVGRDAGARVLSGRITRGSGETLRAAIWYCDMRDFTGLSERLPQDAVIGLLNDYLDTVAGPVQAYGGEILKFVGDGMLAIFPIAAGDPAGEACGRALAATTDAGEAMAALNRRRTGAGEAPLDYGIALHVGDVVYGNVGAANRLDFTVIGPAVNLATRIEGVCKIVKRRPLMSGAFVEAAGCSADPVGRFELKGIATPQEVFALGDGPASPVGSV